MIRPLINPTTGISASGQPVSSIIQPLRLSLRAQDGVKPAQLAALAQAPYTQAPRGTLRVAAAFDTIPSYLQLRF